MARSEMIQIGAKLLHAVTVFVIVTQLCSCAGNRALTVSPDHPRLAISIDRMAVHLGADSMTTQLESTVTGLSKFKGQWYSVMFFQYVYAGSFSRELGLSGIAGPITDAEPDSISQTSTRNLSPFLTKEEADAWAKEGGEWVVIPIAYVVEGVGRNKSSKVVFSMVGEPKVFKWSESTKSLLVPCQPPVEQP